jgi:hypothetical protein
MGAADTRDDPASKLMMMTEIDENMMQDWCARKNENAKKGSEDENRRGRTPGHWGTCRYNMEYLYPIPV